MKLSEAIRLGAMLKPQGRGQLFDGVATCALGAALDACAMPLDDISAAPILETTWPFLLTKAACPHCGGYSQELAEIVVHLNDWHRWTREDIASWMERIESESTQPEHASETVGA